MRIALAQTEIFSKQYEKNKETAVSICNLAQAMEVRLLLFPEMSFTGFNMDTDYSIAAGLDTVPWMQTLAATGECYLGFGWVKAAESGKSLQHCCSGRFSFLRYGKTASLFLCTRRPIF